MRSHGCCGRRESIYGNRWRWLDRGWEVEDAQPFAPVEAWPGAAPMAELRALLARAQRPFLLLGGSAWDGEAVSRIEAFAAANALPVGCAFRRQDRFDNDHPCYAGDVGLGVNPKLAQRITASDLLIALGGRLGEATTGGYTLIDIPAPRQRLVHVHPDPDELGRVYQPALAIPATPRGFAAAVAALAPIADPAWAEATKAAHAEYLAWRKPPRSPGEIQLGEIMLWLDTQLPPDAIVTNGAGNFATWVHRFYRYRKLGSQLAPTSGSMGYGFPAAVGAKILHPDRIVVCVAGDGDFLMTGQELATVAQHKVGVIVLIVNNGMYGTIRTHQERHFPGRVIATALVNPDFAALARSYGISGETVTRTAEFAPAFERAQVTGGPALIELKVDPEALTITHTIRPSKPLMPR
ncbi:MAG: hypothetical protein LAN36_02270 [Acidobacteriia bacterium]|nr:hypothetical protein [Terriglobia bacterium]